MRKDYNLEKRKYIIGGFIVVIAIIYIARLFMLQIVDTDYRRFAEGNAFLKKVQYPSRGLIYDREGRLMVYNQSAYDVMMIPREVKEFDTLAFCNAIDITKEEFDRDHSGIAHGGFVMRSGKTGENGETTEMIEYSLKLGSNPEFTASVIVAYARAAYRMNKEGSIGAKTVFDVPPAYLSPKSPEELRKNLL